MSRFEQRRAAFALSKVEALRSHPAKTQAKYKTQLLKLPARLHTNGLAQAVAFYLSAGAGSPEAEICGWLEDWLRRAEIYPATRSLIHCIAAGDLPVDDYRQASTEARLLATWMKRFAEAFIEAAGDAA